MNLRRCLESLSIRGPLTWSFSWLRATALATLVASFVVFLGDVARAQPNPSIPSVSFQRHVVALFGKLGCNGGTCHGAVQGKAGFRLTMFSADPDADWHQLVRGDFGRRVDPFAAPDSLLLRKALGLAGHGGGRRLVRGDADYESLRKWIAAGMPRDDRDASRVIQLRVSPAQRTGRVSERYELRVEAEFQDGSREDVTGYCSFQSLTPSVASVHSSGSVEVLAPGEGRLMVRYRAQPAIATVLVPYDDASPFPETKPRDVLDVHLVEKLRGLNLRPSPECDDATFLRRATLDLTGALPTPEEARDFLADTLPDRHQRWIDRQLASPAHADLWAMKFCDLLKAADFGVYADALSKEHDAPRMQAWLRARLRENTPYDQLVERILLATSREGRSMDAYADEVEAMFRGYAPGRPDLDLYANRRTLDLYWQRRGSDGVSGAMQVAHAFLGLRLECAQCHRHPHDLWQQDDLLDFANFFMRVRTVGFQGENEKRFEDAASHFKRWNEEAKRLESQVKQRREGDGKRLEDDGKKARAAIDQAKRDIVRLEAAAKAARGKPENGPGTSQPETSQPETTADTIPKDSAELNAARNKLKAAQEIWDRAEAYRVETAEIERRAKYLPEAARRLLQAECRLLPSGKPAKVSSTLGTRESSVFRLLGESQPTEVAAMEDPRAAVVNWMRRRDNPFFVRAIVNRVWAHYFGRGLIDPPDNLSAFNAASHEVLLRDLCERFVASGYDLRVLHRRIAGSQAYRQASATVADASYYAAFPLRRLPAEVLLDALNAATGVDEDMDMKYHHWPPRSTTVQVPFAPRNMFVSQALEMFGRPARNAAVQCDCERDGESSIFQLLALANHPRIWEKIKAADGRVARLLAVDLDNSERLDELFLAVLSRFPSAEERTGCLEFVAAATTPADGWHGVLWGLLNTREFVLQH
ncbi:MAG: DUF1549 domain-containing protein [Planctomycetota bacterium]